MIKVHAHGNFGCKKYINKLKKINSSDKKQWSLLMIKIFKFDITTHSPKIIIPHAQISKVKPSSLTNVKFNASNLFILFYFILNLKF